MGWDRDFWHVCIIWHTTVGPLIFQNLVPDPAGGAYSAPPDPLAVMGWDRDFWHVCIICHTTVGPLIFSKLGSTLFRMNFVQLEKNP